MRIGTTKRDEEAIKERARGESMTAGAQSAPGLDLDRLATPALPVLLSSATSSPLHSTTSINVKTRYMLSCIMIGHTFIDCVGSQAIAPTPESLAAASGEPLTTASG